MSEELNGLYPVSWSNFIGQDEAKERLQIACESAKARGVRLPHVLLASGEPGVGKTSLALLCAKEMGSHVKVISGKTTAAQARMALAELNDRDVLVYDEIHMAVAGGKAQAESWMLHLLENGSIIGPLGPEEQPDITIIGATTDPGRLPQTILDRFPIKPQIRAYDDTEAALIAMEMANRIFTESKLPLPTGDNLRLVASASVNNPRVMRGLLESIRDRAITKRDSFSKGTGYDVGRTLAAEGLTEDGLTLTARRYLTLLKTQFTGGAGERALVDALGEPGGLGHVERVLMAKGLIAKTKAGRVLTQQGIQRARALEAVA